MIKEKIKKFKEWLIIKLGGYVLWTEAKAVVICSTTIPAVYKVSYKIPLDEDKRVNELDPRYIKDTLYSKAYKDILPRISKITSQTFGGMKAYTLTIKAIQENDDDTISG